MCQETKNHLNIQDFLKCDNIVFSEDGISVTQVFNVHK